MAPRPWRMWTERLTATDRLPLYSRFCMRIQLMCKVFVYFLRCYCDRFDDVSIKRFLPDACWLRL